MTNKLRYYDNFSASAAIYIPTTQDVDTPASQSAVDNAISEAATLMSLMYGGATVTTGDGAWYSDARQDIVKERVYIVKAAAMQITDEQIDKLVDFAEEIRERFNQEAVTLEINGDMHFIDGTHTAYAEFDNPVGL